MNNNTSQIHPNAKIGENVTIEPFVIIEDNVEIDEGCYVESYSRIKSGARIGKNCHISQGSIIACPTIEPKFSEETPYTIIGDNVRIEPYVTVYDYVNIAEECYLGTKVVIMAGAEIGKKCKIHAGAVISNVPQDLKFEAETSKVIIGENTVIREFATVNRGTRHDNSYKTIIGKNCLIMAYVHLAHDCVLGDNCILSNSVQVAGHVQIGNYVIIGGTAAIHQFVKIGDHAMVGGGSLLRKDVPPYIIAGREPVTFEGINTIGLRRRSFDNERITHIQDIYRTLFNSGLNNSQAIITIENNIEQSQDRNNILDFIRNSSRGIIR